MDMILLLTPVLLCITKSTNSLLEIWLCSLSVSIYNSLTSKEGTTHIMQLKSTHLLKMTSGNEDLNCIHNCAAKHMTSNSHGHCTHGKKYAVNFMISFIVCFLLGWLQETESYILYILDEGINASTIIMTFMNSSVYSKNIREGHTHVATTVHYMY
jgi:hypothetical protein